MSTRSKNSPLVFLFGPTGVGKTNLLFDHLAEEAEVVTVDSIQVYRGLDLGSAKPTSEELKKLRHHLIDVRDPWELWDAGDFVEAADLAVEEIEARGKLPVLCGGTAFYFVNYLFGLPLTPVSEPHFRRQAEELWKDQGEAPFRSLLAAVDPVSEARILPHDVYRLLRAYEVWLQTGRPLSSFDRPKERRTQREIFIAGLDRPREELYQRIDHRVDEMIGAGLIEEVRGLLAKGLDEKTPALKAIGYAEFLPWLLKGEGDQSSAVERVKQNSRRYAKRQLTFFRSLPDVRWFHPDDHAALLKELRSFLVSEVSPG